MQDEALVAVMMELLINLGVPRILVRYFLERRYSTLASGTFQVNFLAADRKSDSEDFVNQRGLAASAL